MRIRINVPYTIFLFYFYFFIFYQLLVDIFPLAGYADELAAFAAVPFFVINIVKRRGKIHRENEKWWPFIWIFLCIGFLGNIFYQYQPIFQVAIPDMFLCVKFWFAIYTGKNLLSNLDFQRFSRKIFFHIRVVTWMYAVLIVLDQILHIFDTTIRYGIRATTLFYGHPTCFAASCALLISILLSVSQYIEGYTRYFFFLLILLCTTLRSKAFGAAFVFLFIYYVILYKRKKLTVRTFLFLIPAVLVIAWEQIEYYFFGSIQSDSARYQLTTKAFQVAADHFPLGSGFGSFASYFSSVVYSPLYNMYHLSSVNGLRKGAAYFVSDSFWPMILGQTGWIGFALTALAMVCLFLRIQAMRKEYPFYNAAGLCILIYLLISSLAEAAFVHSIAIPLAIWMGVLLQKSHERD